MNVRSLSIKAKLGAGFGLLALMVLIVSAMALRALGTEHHNFTTFVDQTNARVAMANQLLDAASARAVAARNLVLVTNASDKAMETAAVQAAHKAVGDSLARLQAAIQALPATGSRERQLFDAVRSIESRYGPVALDIVDKAIRGDKEAAVTKMNAECRPLLAALLKASEDYIVFTSDLARQDVAAAQTSYDASRGGMLAVSLLAVASAALLAYLITRAILGPIGLAVQVAQTVAGGDLRSDVPQAGTDETGQLLAALKAMNDSLVGIVRQVRQGSESIATGSAQIATGNTDLSDRTEKQAGHLEQTASSMEQMTATVKSNSDTARAAAELAGTASQSARRGGEVVGQVVATMDGISAASRKIADIIGVIDGIAFQTNILALNAAVEAARAGEQGRGFAVVAAEVRALAQRSAEAAKEIGHLIHDSGVKVDAGARLVSDARASMQDIVSQVSRVAELINEINAATGEQSAGIGQVNTAIGELDRATQQNAALVEQSAAAADSLRKQASRLMELVGVFKLSGSGEPAATAAQPEARDARTPRAPGPLSARRPALRLGA